MLHKKCSLSYSLTEFINGKLYCFAYIGPDGMDIQPQPFLRHEAYNSCSKLNATLPLPLDYNELKQLQLVFSRLIKLRGDYHGGEAVFLDAYYSVDKGNFVFNL